MDKQNLEFITPTLSDVDPLAAEQKEAENKYTQLEQAKQAKLDSLSINNKASLDSDSVTLTDEGNILSNRNKIYNDLYSGDLNFIYDEVKNQALTQNENGQWGRISQDEQGIETFTPYEGSVRRLYGYNTDKGEFKLGLARGDLPSSDMRYIPGAAEEAGLRVGKDGYGWAPGPEGLNLDKKVLDIVVPYETATAFEGLVHGNKNALNQRVNMFSSEEERNAGRERYGSGASEYYKSEQDIFDPQYRQKSDEELRQFFKEQSLLPEVQDKWAGYSDYAANGIRIRNRNEMTEEEKAAELRLLSQMSTEEGTVMARAGNAVDAFQRTLYKEAVLDFSDWVGEGLEYLTDGAVGWDHGTEEEKTQWVNETFGFRPELANAAYREAKVHADSIADALFDENKDVNFGDVYELVKIGITTPEMLGDSIGFLGSFFIPIAGWGGKAAKVDKAVRKIEAAKKAGLITKDAAKAAVAAEKANLRTLSKLRNFTQKNAGLMQVAAGNVNDQIDAYKEEFNEDPSIAKVAQMMATETILLGLDRFVDLSILKSPGALKGYKDAFSILPVEGKAKVVANAVARAGGLLTSMGKEAAQEYLQEIGQEFNVKFNFDQTGSVAEAIDEAGKVLFDKETQAKGIMGAGLGAGGAVQFKVVGMAAKAPQALAKLGSKSADLAKNAATKAATQSEPEPDSSEAQSEAAATIQEAIKTANEGNNIAASFFATQSGSAEEKAKASAKVKQAKESILDGSNEVFSSDGDLNSKLPKLDPIIEAVVADDPSVGINELLDAVARNLKPATEEEVRLVEETVTKAHANGLRYAQIKPMAEVAEDVSVGPRGFISYFNAAKAAKIQNNESAFNAALGKLDYFLGYQIQKSERIKEGIEQVTALINGQVDILVKQGKAKTRQEALAQLTAKYEKEDNKLNSLTIKNSSAPNSRTTQIDYLDVAKNMADSRYNRGIFRLQNTVNAEVEQMSQAYSVLVEQFDLDDTPAATVASVDTSVPSEAEVEMPAAADVDMPTVEAGDVAVDETVDIPAEAEVDIPQEIDVDTDFVVPPETDEDIDATVPPELDVPPMSDAEIEAAYSAQADADLDTVVPVDEDFSVVPDELLETQVEEDFSVAPGEQTVEEKVEKTESSAKFSENRKAIKDVQKRIQERRSQLRARRIFGKEQLKDDKLVALLEEKQALVEESGTFVSVLTETIAKRIEKLGRFAKGEFQLYRNFSQGGKGVPVNTTLSDLFAKMKATAFTLAKRTAAEANTATKKLGAKLPEIIKGQVDTVTTNGDVNKSNLLLMFLYDEEGNINYNALEAVEAALYEYFLQNASNLRGKALDDEAIGELVGLPEEFVTPELSNMLANGGTLVKLAAADVGSKIIDNLGIELESIQDREALATAFGMMALELTEGELSVRVEYVPSEEERKRKQSPIKKERIEFIVGTSDLFDKMKQVKKNLARFEDLLGIEFDKERTYRKEPTNTRRKVTIRRSEYQDAPKDHTDVVNRLENTAFAFNSGNDVLFEMFSDEEGNLDTKALVSLILGPESKITNEDGRSTYIAQKEALERTIQFYLEAKEDIKDGNLFFNWFIAKNHRIHLDSNRINPQGDKHLARWLLTTANSKKSINVNDIEAVINGQEGSMEAVMFAYSIVQAFDGAPGVVGIDKDNQTEVLAAAKKILEETSEAKLMQMAKESAHIGHAALAIANIRRYMDAGDGKFESDMVLEVDGLTNGFAFRSMQFPIQTEGSPFTPEMWLEKVGIVLEGSDLFELESMNGARSKGQEDVYISVGQEFNQLIAGQKDTLDATSVKWISLFEKYEKLPDFSDTTDSNVKKFIRNLMKSPVMIFNYAAGLGNIANSLVNDQILGKNYLSGKALIDLLTEKKGEEYLVTKEELTSTFGEVLGERYHKARMALHKKKLEDSTNADIIALRTSLNTAITGLYSEPLKKTLETYFEAQTQVNNVFTNAAQFMFDYFKEEFNLWKIQNPKASEEDKLEFLKDMATVIPGVAGASTDDQRTKVTFLKNALEQTSNDVLVNIGGERRTSNTVSRDYGEPGVGPAVLTVLSLDSSVLAKALNDAFKGTKDGALPIHDAMVLGIGDHGAINSYNRIFYSTNKGYSISQEFVNAMDNFEKMVPNPENRSIITIEGKTLTLPQLMTSLKVVNNIVQNGRKKLFSQKVKSGQMVGPDGTMVTIDVSAEQESSKAYLAKASSIILDKFQNDVIKDALSEKQYKKAMKRLVKMLEGCK